MTAQRQKLKLLFLARIFFEKTDADHGLSMPQLIAALEELGITAERKALYRDIKALQEFGFDIRTYQRHPVEYALATRRFSASELMLLADAVQSSRFLTRTKSAELLRAIKTLGSKHQARALSRRVHVADRVKTQNESVFRNVDIIQEALRTRRKVVFHYFKYDADKKQRMQHQGKPYLATPVCLIYSDGYYYLVTYNDKHQGFTNYRVDRMASLRVSEERATRNDAIASFDADTYQSCSFGMYRGTRTACTLLVHEDAMSGVIDRFGKDVSATPADTPADAAERGESGKWAHVSAPVMESPVFFGWVAQFGGRVRIERPTALAEAYARHLESILAAQRNIGKR